MVDMKTYSSRVHQRKNKKLCIFRNKMCSHWWRRCFIAIRIAVTKKQKKIIGVFISSPKHLMLHRPLASNAISHNLILNFTHNGIQFIIHFTLANYYYSSAGFVVFGWRDRMLCNKSSFHFSSDISLAQTGVNSVGIDICDIADSICSGFK